jgi:hypothetical protein
LKQAAALAAGARGSAGAEIIAAIPDLPDGLADAKRLVSAVKKSGTPIDLSNIRPGIWSRGDLPWQRGERLAGGVRAQLGLAVDEPLTDTRLGEFLGLRVPVEGRAPPGARVLAGAYRPQRGASRVMVPGHRREQQRFHLGKVVAAATFADEDQDFLPVSSSETWRQKAARAFSVELFCPWEDLDAFTDDRGTGGPAIEDAAERYGISEYAVLTKLVNRGKLSRAHLPPELA